MHIILTQTLSERLLSVLASKIKYDKSYEYLMNEYMGLMFGSDGIYLNNPNITVGDVKDLTIFFMF